MTRRSACLLAVCTGLIKGAACLETADSAFLLQQSAQSDPTCLGAEGVDTVSLVMDEWKIWGDTKYMAHLLKGCEAARLLNESPDDFVRQYSGGDGAVGLEVAKTMLEVMTNMRLSAEDTEKVLLELKDRVVVSVHKLELDGWASTNSKYTGIIEPFKAGALNTQEEDEDSYHDADRVLPGQEENVPDNSKNTIHAFRSFLHEASEQMPILLMRGSREPVWDVILKLAMVQRLGKRVAVTKNHGSLDNIRAGLLQYAQKAYQEVHKQLDVKTTLALSSITHLYGQKLDDVKASAVELLDAMARHNDEVMDAIINRVSSNFLTQKEGTKLPKYFYEWCESGQSREDLYQGTGDMVGWLLRLECADGDAKVSLHTRGQLRYNLNNFFTFLHTSTGSKIYAPHLTSSHLVSLFHAGDNKMFKRTTYKKSVLDWQQRCFMETHLTAQPGKELPIKEVKLCGKEFPKLNMAFHLRQNNQEDLQKVLDKARKQLATN